MSSTQSRPASVRPDHTQALSPDVRRRRQSARERDNHISRAFHHLGKSSQAAMFAELLLHVRQRSDLLGYDHLGGEQPGVDALRNLAEFSGSFVRAPRNWPGATGSVYEIVASLAQHLLCRYPVPRFLNSVWFGACSSFELRRRRWYHAHGSGHRFRDLELPLAMTRRMERHFLASADHLTVEAAIRRAEYLALGASPELAQAVCDTRLGRDLSRGEFWRTVAHFLVRVEPDLDLILVPTIVDFIHTVRHVETSDGETASQPLAPDFSVKGRTLASMLTLIRTWHGNLGSRSGARVSWTGSSQRPMVFETKGPHDDRVVWRIVELTDSGQLDAEGRALRHCLSSYAVDCLRGLSRIWSLRRLGGDRPRSVATIEVDPDSKEIVQVKGLNNRPVTGRSMDWIRSWAAWEGLRQSF